LSKEAEMRFPWEKYEEIVSERKNTLQIFITDRCNLRCDGCFARNIMGDDSDISTKEYLKAIEYFIKKGGKQINILGGEPLLHPNLKELLKINKKRGIKTTVYTNGHFLSNFKKQDFDGAKLRVSLYCNQEAQRALTAFPRPISLSMSAIWSQARLPWMRCLIQLIHLKKEMERSSSYQA